MDGHSTSENLADWDLAQLLRQVFIDFTPMREFAQSPLILTEGSGVRVRDHLGKWYLDGISGVFVSSVGHGNQRVVEAMVEQARRLAFGAPLYSSNASTLLFANRLLEVVDDRYSAVKLTAAGSEATESAIKMSRQYHRLVGDAGRYKILSHYHSYHGSTGFALAASGSARGREQFEPYPTGFVHLHPPWALQRLLGVDEFAAVDAALELASETISQEDSSSIAMLITEPIWLAAGVHVASQAYLEGLQQLCRHHGILLAFDEIITGFGRTGRLLAAEHSGVMPDLLCFGKGIAGGYAALAGTLVSEQLTAVFWGDQNQANSFSDGHTFGNNPLAAAVAHTVLDMLLDGLIENAARQGQRIRTMLDECNLAGVAEIRGLGLLLGVAFGGDGPTGRAVAEQALRRGLIVRRGTDFVAIGPPLCIDDDATDELASILIESIQAA